VIPSLAGDPPIPGEWPNLAQSGERPIPGSDAFLLERIAAFEEGGFLEDSLLFQRNLLNDDQEISCYFKEIS
jgi:hypothetical protein